jgi:hypothetical protein
MGLAWSHITQDNDKWRVDDKNVSKLIGCNKNDEISLSDK